MLHQSKGLNTGGLRVIESAIIFAQYFCYDKNASAMYLKLFFKENWKYN